MGDKLGIGRDCVQYLRVNNLLIKPIKNYHTTTNSYHMFRKHKNLIADLPIVRSEQMWVSDITYIGSRGQNSYLALVTDAYSKKTVVGYDLSDSFSAQGVVRADN